MLNVIDAYVTQWSDWLFGKPKTLDEKLAEIREELKKTERELGKDIVKIEIDIALKKKEIQFAKAKNTNITAKELDPIIINIVRMESRKMNLVKSQGKINDFQSMLTNVKTSTQMTESFMKLTSALNTAGRQFNVQQIYQMMNQYNLVTQKMELFEETINDASMFVCFSER